MTKSSAKSAKAGYIDYFPGAPLRKVAHRSVSSSKTVPPLKRRRAVARRSIPPRKLILKKKPAARWSSNYCVSLSVSDKDYGSKKYSDYDSDSGSSRSCCSSMASNVPNWSSGYSVSVSDEDYYSSSSSSSSGSDSGSCSCSTTSSSGSSNHSSPVYEKPTVYVLCTIVNGVLVRV